MYCNVMDLSPLLPNANSVTAHRGSTVGQQFSDSSLSLKSHSTIVKIIESQQVH